MHCPYRRSYAARVWNCCSSERADEWRTERLVDEQPSSVYMRDSIS